MAYLNWKTEPVQVVVAPHARHQTELSLTLQPKHAAELAGHLQQSFASSQEETRLDLPSGWTIFFKQRDGDSRALLAHPAQDEWVATVALAEPEAKALLAALAGQGAQSLSNLSRVSNLQLTIAIL